MQHSVLVTGGAGFIGSHICVSLLEQGHRITVLDDLDDYYPASLKMRNLREIDKRGTADFVKGDVMNGRLLRKIIKGNDIDTIYHLAARPGVAASVKDPVRTDRTNVGGTLNMLVAAQAEGVERVINTSSSSVYGKAEYLPFDEGHPRQPISPYGLSKLTGEHYCELFSEMYGMKIISLRFFSVYGPRMRPDLAISKFTRKALRDEVIAIYGNGGKSRDFTHIDDVVKASLLFLDKSISGVYNVGFGQRTTIGELARMITDITGSSSEVRHTPSKEGDMEHTQADVASLRNALGWAPAVPLDLGLKNYVEQVMNGHG